MLKKLLRTSISSIILAILLLPVLPTKTAQAITEVPTIYEYLNTGGDGDSAAIYLERWAAMTFTSKAISHTVKILKLDLKKVGSPGSLTVSIRKADGSYFPTGSDLASGTYNGNYLSTAYSYAEFTLDGPVTELTLEGATKYSILLRALAGDSSNYVMWHQDNDGGLANAVSVHSTNGGNTYTDDAPKDSLFEVWGNPTIRIDSVNVFSGYISPGDLLFTIYAKNTLRPYYSLQDTKAYFDLVLYQTNGTTVIASRPMLDWGMRPQAIYLNVSAAAPITLGSALVVKIVGSFAADITASRTLASSDWKGNDLTLLDTWVRLTAKDIESSYNSTLLKSVSGIGLVLNSVGAPYFDNGIPGLSNYRPHLFETATVNLASDHTVRTNIYDASKDLTTSIGPNLVTLTTETGALVGMSSHSTISTILFVVFLALCMILFVKGQFLFAVIAALPILFLGMGIGAISFAYVGALCAMLFVVFIFDKIMSKV